MLFGAANIHLDTLGIPHVTGYREHLYARDAAGRILWPSLNGPIPATWPVTPAGITGFYTIYPNPDLLLAGKMDGRLRAFIDTAPPQGGVLTAYAEADALTGLGGQFANAGLTKAKVLRVHRKMHQLCHGSRVKYGPVVCGTGLEAMSFCPPGMDFYGLDWYDTWRPPLIQALTTWRGNTERIQPAPVLAIAETNSRVVAHRPAWFAMAYAWLAAYDLEHGGHGALGYWSYWRTDAGTGSLSGPWIPGDTATIDALTLIAAHAGADA